MTSQGAPGELLIFVLLLPDPVPLPHGSTWTHELDLPAPGLEGVARQVTADTPTREPAGFNFVSLKFWQVREASAHSYSAASRVVDAISSTVRLSDSAGPQTEDAYRTVVEAVTWVEDSSDREEASRALDRCVDELLALHRSYRLGARALVPSLTYERIHPVVMRLGRRPESEDPAEVHGIVILDHTNMPVAAPEPLKDATREEMALVSPRLSAGDPFMLYMERRLEGMTEGLVNGRHGESVVQTAIAAEILLDAILGLLMWEESEAEQMTEADAAAVFSTDLLPRVRSEYHPRLGGQWALGAENLSPWYEQLARLRGRVVHAGYRPDAVEAQLARNALVTLESFIGDRLAKNSSAYPKTAWLFLGDAGFAKRGKPKAPRKWAEALGQPIAEAQRAWVHQYVAWREAVNADIQLRQKKSP